MAIKVFVLIDILSRNSNVYQVSVIHISKISKTYEFFVLQVTYFSLELFETVFVVSMILSI